MAKITGPFMSFGASGALAKTLVASKWKGRPYLRQHVVPANPRTSEQTLTRNTFKWGSDIYKNMGTIPREPWTSYVQGLVMDGRNAFMKFVVQQLREETDLAQMIFSPGSKGGIAPSAMDLTPGDGSITVDFTAPAAPAGWTLTAVQAVAIADQDPQTELEPFMVAGEDTAEPIAQVVLNGLENGTLYTVGGWTKWTKPDGSFAYGPSLTDQATPAM